jgi:hypothetical protein
MVGKYYVEASNSGAADFDERLIFKRCCGFDKAAPAVSYKVITNAGIDWMFS